MAFTNDCLWPIPAALAPETIDRFRCIAVVRDASPYFHLGHRPDRHDPFKNSDVHAGLRFGWLRAFVLQQKTKRTVQFEITAPTREAIAS